MFSAHRFRQATAFAKIGEGLFNKGSHFIGTNYVPKLYQTSADGTNYHPVRNASIAMFSDLPTAYNDVSSEVTGVYPAFQDLEISGNSIQSETGAGVLLTGTRNDHIDRNRLTGCCAVPDADPIYSYFGAKSKSALVLSFAENVAARDDVTTADPICAARMDPSSSRNVSVHQQ